MRTLAGIAPENADGQSERIEAPTVGVPAFALQHGPERVHRSLELIERNHQRKF
jgi:hypothetical protein